MWGNTSIRAPAGGVTRPWGKRRRMAIYLHIGLPKTGTTYWQYLVFPKIRGITYVHRSQSDLAGQEINRILRALHHAGTEPVGGGWRGRIARLIGQGRRTAPREGLRDGFDALFGERPDGEDRLLSCENISLTSDGFWNGRVATPEGVAAQLAAMDRQWGGGQVRIILTTRQPDSWLAARYAESAKDFDTFSNGDFARRAEALLSEPLTPWQRWIDSRHVLRVFEDVFGAAHVFRMPLERLAEHPAQSILEMGRFIGGRDLGYVVEMLERQGKLGARSNSLRAGDGEWRLRSTGEVIGYPPGLDARVRQRFDG